MTELTKLIIKLINERGFTKAQVERECGLANGTIHNWEKGRNNPSEMAIDKISKCLGVSISYTIGQEKATPQEQPLTDKQEQVLSLAKNLSDEDMKKLIDYAELLMKAKNQ